MSNHRLGRAVIECGRSKSEGFERNQRARKARRWKLDEDGEYVPNVPKGSPQLSDHLAPLERWLLRNVGRPWARVYRDFCAREDKRTLRGDHVHRHLKEMVRGAGGREGDYRGYGPYHPTCAVYLHGPYYRFWIDARTSLLRHHARHECAPYSRKHYGWTLPPPRTYPAMESATGVEYINGRPVRPPREKPVSAETVTMRELLEKMEGRAVEMVARLKRGRLRDGDGQGGSGIR
jgi:hypothetical protein